RPRRRGTPLPRGAAPPACTRRCRQQPCPGAGLDGPCRRGGHPARGASGARARRRRGLPDAGTHPPGRRPNGRRPARARTPPPAQSHPSDGPRAGQGIPRPITPARRAIALPFRLTRRGEVTIRKFVPFRVKLRILRGAEGGSMSFQRRLPPVCGALSLVLCLGIAELAVAQTTSASVSGTVGDEQGGVLPGVIVTLTSRTQGTTLTQTTDDQGRFTFAIVRPDTYALKAELQGFKTFEQTNVVVNANDRLSVGLVRLQVGDI